MLATDANIWQSLIGRTSSTITMEPNSTTIQPNGSRSIDLQKRIAVITPYQAQVNRLREVLPPAIEVMTINRPRLNVMLTRAKYGLYIFGNLTWLSQQDNLWTKLINNAHNRTILRVSNQRINTLPQRQTI